MQVDFAVHRVEHISDRFLQGKKLGSGTYASVFLATDVNGREVALKRYRESSQQGIGLLEEVVRELMLMRRLDHANILQLFEVVHCEGTIHASIEFMPMTLEKLVDQRIALPEPSVKRIAVCLLRALEHCHGHGIIHRDLSAGNVFLSAAEGEFECKLGDFNLSRLLSSDQGPLTPGMVTLQYRAPEILAGTNYSSAVDLWALGCVLAEALRGRMLFVSHTELGLLAEQVSMLDQGNVLVKREQLRSLMRGRKQRRCNDKSLAQRLSKSSADALAFVSSLLQLQPNQRPSASACFEHSFVR